MRSTFYKLTCWMNAIGKKGFFFVGLLAVSSAWAAPLEVEGLLIDIRPVKRGESVFPQVKKYRYGKPPKLIDGLKSAVGMVGYEGVTAVRSVEPTEVLLGLSVGDFAGANWESTGQRVYISADTYYYLYRHAYKTAGERLAIPQTAGTLPPIVFARDLKIAQVPALPGIEIARIKTLGKGMLSNPNFVILPEGDLLASCSGLGGTTFFVSKDRGQTWQFLSRNNEKMTFTKVFLHRGKLYMMGIRNAVDTPDKRGLIAISRSDDGGKTWTPITDENSGVIMRGSFHSAPVPLVEHNGRLWRGIETRDDPKKPTRLTGMGVISAPADADLLKAENWTLSAIIPQGEPDAIEGNMVVAPDGSLKNILRYNAYQGTEKAAVMRVDSPTEVQFDPAEDVIDFPGGAKKFFIQYDPQTKRYWAIASVANHAQSHLPHAGRFAEGVHNGLLRNQLALLSSTDLKQWNVNSVLIDSDNPFFDGFQYVVWRFDGDDIIAVSRTAFPEARGLPIRQHDANLLTFHRFKNFRTQSIPTLKVHTLPPLSANVAPLTTEGTVEN